MAKQTKRMRKFVSSGGVQGRLRKGTITKKGVLKRKGGSNNNKDGDNASGNKRSKLESDHGLFLSEQKQKREDADFVSEKNLGNMDIESFFEAFGEQEGRENIEEEAGQCGGDQFGAVEQEDKGIEFACESNESVTFNQDGISLFKKTSKEQEQRRYMSSESDSEEEDVNETERLLKEEIGNLQEKDPEFHQFLKENEEVLLTYGIDSEEEEDYDDDYGHDNEMEQDGQSHFKKPGESVGDVDAKDGKISSRDGSIPLTAAMMEKMERSAFKCHSVKALKRVVNAFKSACNLADLDGAKHSHGSGPKYHIESSEVFNRLMILSMAKCHDEFYYHLLGKGAPLYKNGEVLVKKSTVDGNEDGKDQIDEIENNWDPNKSISPKVLERAERWDDLRPIVFTFIKSAMHILSEAKQPELVVFALKTLSDYVPYMTPFPRLVEQMLKTLTDLWSAPIDSSEEYQVVRLHSFLRIRQLAITQPFPFIEESLKKVYLAYAQRAKFATASSVTSALPTLTFMGNCVVELYSLDYHSSYQHAFIYIRQLALHLRNAMQKKTADTLGAVYCWQFLHCLKLWVAVISEACKNENEDGFVNNGDDQLLRSLIFPLSQVILGTARLIPSSRYLPLRLHCVRLLQQLAAAAEIFLPTTSILLDVFDLHEFSQPPKKVPKRNVQPLALTLKLCADNPLRSMEELEMCLAEVFVLLNREMDLYRFSPGFPEFSVRINQRLKKFAKDARHARWRAYAKGCLDLCDRYSSQAVRARANLNDVAPKDVKQLEVLKPLETASMGERYAQSVEKEKRLETSSRPVQKATTKPQEETNGDSKENSGGKKKSKKTKYKLGKAKEVKDSARWGALDQDDVIEEGINWSDNEE